MGGEPAAVPRDGQRHEASSTETSSYDFICEDLLVTKRPIGAVPDSTSYAERGTAVLDCTSSLRKRSNNTNSTVAV